MYLLYISLCFEFVENNFIYDNVLYPASFQSSVSYSGNPMNFRIFLRTKHILIPRSEVPPEYQSCAERKKRRLKAVLRWRRYEFCEIWSLFIEIKRTNHFLWSVKSVREGVCEARKGEFSHRLKNLSPLSFCCGRFPEV